ncbi:chondroitin sulfate synthase 1-like [Anneissia japonica]|uniref:chondroitin sulfate synthase 1-like n=1 Tax=Anneissia japonica TaxID=1529436 RepID=UPI0014255A2F|nr:chondroitin sulfate synthase 1-like [Anneissia japonica]
MAMRRSRLYSREVWSILVSLVVSFCLTTWLRISVISVSPGSPKDVGCKHYVKSELNGGLQENLHQRTSREQPVPTSKLLFVGVMTAEKYLSTRCLAVHKTWANTIPGKVMCFTSGTSKVNESLHIPVVKLPSVDDSYPPQKKSFMMLKYIHDNYIDEYEWFMRADDDVYVRGDKMETFLRSINSSKTLFMGQAGLGSKEEEGLLNLKQGENFCMGGPGMIFSRETLRRMIPHISYCLKNLWSTHEDVEVGRCVKKFAGVDCTWSFEVGYI